MLFYEAICETKQVDTRSKNPVGVGCSHGRIARFTPPFMRLEASDARIRDHEIDCSFGIQCRVSFHLADVQPGLRTFGRLKL